MPTITATDAPPRDRGQKLGWAVIETAIGTILYRRYNKPALGPVGDSLDDFAGRGIEQQ